MSNYSTLKADIINDIKQNGSNAITGQLLQDNLIAMVNSLGAGYQYMGVADLNTPSSSPDYKCFYIVSEAGTYTNFVDSNNDPLVVNDGEVAIFKWDSAWSKEVTGAATAAQTQTALKQSVYDVSANNGGATFADLSTLLSDANLATLIPVGERCGGMSIRFVQTSDNRYVQFRLMKNVWSTDTNDWALCSEDVLIENPEWVKVVTDSQDRILCGIKADGSIDWLKGVPVPIKEYINTYNIELAKIHLERSILQGEGFAIKDSVKKQLIVDCNGHGATYYTIQSAINAIENPSNINQYEIIVFPGTYYENNLLVPAWTHIHGLRPNSVIVSSKNQQDITTEPVFDQSYGSSKLSNMTIESYTGYCIHFDSHDELQMASLVNENLVLNKCHKGNQSTNSIIGGGSFKYGTIYHWNNCTFIGSSDDSPNDVDVACHTNKDAHAENTHLKFTNCKFINCSLHILSVGGFGHCVCEIDNCSFDKGKLGLYTPFSWLRTVNMPYTYTSNTVEWQFLGGGNKNFAPAAFSQGQGLFVESTSAIEGESITVYGTAADIIFGQVGLQKGGSRVKASAIGSYMIYTNVSRGTGASDCFTLHNRLGDMTGSPKTLTIRVKNSNTDRVFNYTFNADYSNLNDDAIIADINSVLEGCTLSLKSPDAWSTFNLVEANMITCTDTNDVLKGTWVTEDGKTCTSATPVKDIYGIALQDAVNGQLFKVWTGDAFHYESGSLRDGEWGICDYINYQVDYPGSSTNFGNISQNAVAKFGKMVNGKLYRY